MVVYTVWADQETIDERLSELNNCCEKCGKEIQKKDRRNDNHDSWQVYYRDSDYSNIDKDNCLIICGECHEDLSDLVSSPDR